MPALTAARDTLRRWMSRRFVRWTLDILLVVAAFAAVSLWQSRGAVRGHAPDISLPSLDGNVVTSGALQGKPTLVVFWAPWCGVCRADVGAVSSLQHLVGDRANVVSIASDYRDVDEVKTWVKDRGVDYPVLLGGTATARRFRVQAFPTLYFLDAHGDVRHAAVGYTTLAGMAWRLFL